MKAQRYRAVGLAVLSSALVLFSGSSVVATSSSSSPSSVCTDASLSDGDCDLSNNTEECGYDGGDCCECTCVDTTKYVCGVRSGFSCLDPSASCFANDGDDDASALPEGDDVTEEPLTPTTTPTSNTTSTEAPAMITPTEAPSTFTTTAVTPTAQPTAEASANRSACLPDSLSDGICDPENNSKDCGYDAGDCCECTCVSTTGFACGATTTFDCVDPGATCFGSDDDGDDDDAIVLRPPSDDSTEQTSTPTSSTTSTEDSLTATPAGVTSTATSACVSDSLSDGSCDADNNSEECGYDGGDCCECTCVDTMDFTCGDTDNGGYDCIDPDASCNELAVGSTDNNACSTVKTSSPIYLLLAMCTYYVLHLRRLYQ